MTNEISEEAKRTLADLPRRKALQRLERDGATSRPAMQRRIQALAAERSIPPADFHKLMYKRPSTQAVIDFCEKHKVSIDWLLCGDLKGLQRMKQEAKAEPPEIPEAQRKEIMRLFSALTPQKQVIGFALLRELLARSIFPNG
jgi:hypothetical protein